MAASNAGCAFRLQSEGTAPIRSRHYPLLRRGIVPHDTSATFNIDRSGFAALRLRARTRSHPRPRARSKAKREQVGERGAKRAVWHHLW